ncbi:MAG: beta-galactosidase, partial [Limisphaerales bacterium]
MTPCPRLPSNGRWPQSHSRFGWCCFLLAWLSSSLEARAADAKFTRVQFREVDTLFANPGQGWMSQARRPQGEPRFPYSVVYLRFDWADAEPEEGKYNWALIDDAIAAWKPQGAAVALRVMTCNAHSRGYYSSPKWLFEAGCKGHEYLRGGDDPTSGGQRIPRIEPDYADPIYL